MSRVAAGVDGGGSRTRVVLLDEVGRELGRAEGGPSAVNPSAPELSAQAVAACLRAAVEAGEVTLPVSVLWAGLAGAGREPARSRVEALLQEAGVAERVHVGTDAEAAFRDAFGIGPGILLVAGTGSVAWARDRDNREYRLGGWGPILGDEGGGYSLAREALRRIAQAVDGRGPETALQEVILAELQLDAPEALIPWAASAPRGQIAALAPRVAETAEAGDAVAREVVAEAVEALASFVRALAAKPGFGQGPRPVALAGGLLRPGGPLRTPVERAVAGPVIRILDRPVDPPHGAAQMARSLLKR